MRTRHGWVCEQSTGLPSKKGCATGPDDAGTVPSYHGASGAHLGGVAELTVLVALIVCCDIIFALERGSTEGVI